MEKKLDELNNPSKDPNSPESQEFLRKLHNELKEISARLKGDMKKWGIERNEP